jgi:hypothetical protein
MQMEGANLYDVFQKIGRGDFQPLPADRFSPAMRGAVQQLLAQDPNTRPSAEQCYQQVLLVQQQLAQLQAVPGQQPQQPAGQQQRQLQQNGSAKQRQVSSGRCPGHIGMLCLTCVLHGRTNSEVCGHAGCWQLSLCSPCAPQLPTAAMHTQDPAVEDACLMSEQLLHTLQVIASSANSSSNGVSRSPSRKRAGSSSAAEGAAALLKQLHPLFFAQPLGAFSRSNGSAALPGVLQEERAQQQQMGVAVTVSNSNFNNAGYAAQLKCVQCTQHDAVATRLCSTCTVVLHFQSDAAHNYRRVQHHLLLFGTVLLCTCCQVCAWLARLANKLDAAQSLEAELKPPRSADSSSSSSGGKSTSRNSRLPLCKDCLRAAEVAHKAAQSMRLQGVDAVPAAQLAQGHGRAVCWLLQGMADVVWGQLQLSCRRNSHSTARGDDALQVEHLQGDGAEDEADIAVAAAALAAAAGESSEDLDDVGFGVAAVVDGQQQQGRGGGKHAAPPTAARHNAAIHTQVGSAVCSVQC